MNILGEINLFNLCEYVDKQAVYQRQRETG